MLNFAVFMYKKQVCRFDQNIFLDSTWFLIAIKYDHVNNARVVQAKAYDAQRIV